MLTLLPYPLVGPSIQMPEEEEIINALKNSQNTGRDTNNTLSPLADFMGYKRYSLGSKSVDREIFGLIGTKLIDKKKTEYDIPSVGVAKLLFESNPIDEDITKEDVEEYKKFLEHYKLKISQPSKRVIVDKYIP